MIALRTLCALTAILATSVCAAAQDATTATDYSKLPGYVDIDMKALLGDEQPPVTIFLEKPILQMLGGMMQTEEPEAAAVIKSLELVRLFIFEGNSEKATKVKSVFDALAKRLESEGWSRAISVEEEGESFSILVKLNGEKCQGMTIVHAGEDEAIFGNVVGDFDPAKLGTILAGGMFDGGGFGDMFGGFMGGDGLHGKQDVEDNEEERIVQKEVVENEVLKHKTDGEIEPEEDSDTPE